MKNVKPRMTRAQSIERIQQAIEAIQAGDQKKLSSIVKTRAQANWLSPAGRGNSLLMHALGSDEPQIVRWLLQKGANLNILFYEDGRRPVVLKQGQGYAEGNYRSPLSTAIHYAEIEIIAELLERGADLSLPITVDYKFGNTTCSDLLTRYDIEGEVQAIRDAMQIAKSLGVTVNMHKAAPKRL
jgi:hypothetical protein